MSGATIFIPTRRERIAALDEAIKRGGGIVAFSRRMGVTHQAIYSWRKRGWVPLERAIAIDATFNVERDRLIAPRLAWALATPHASFTRGAEHDL
ncbi:MAG: helix-turn-helix domain-containing protein [Erythrobacteraceae bacterium]|nr:helix-turn-helix domain-containing protein [Erythrobacteraceae bacterium]